MQAVPSITPSEREIIQHFHKGLDRSKTAKAMNLSYSGLGNHISNLNRKLGTKAYHEIPKRARELGIRLDNSDE